MRKKKSFLLFFTISFVFIKCEKRDTVIVNDKSNLINSDNTMRSAVTYTNQPLYVCNCCQLTYNQQTNEWSCPEPYVDCAKITLVPCYLAKANTSDSVNYHQIKAYINELEKALSENHLENFFSSKKKREILFPELKNDTITTNALLSGKFKVRKFTNSKEYIYTIYNPVNLKSVYSLSFDKNLFE